MKRRIHVSPLENETLSQCQYRAAGMAFNSFNDFDIYYFDGYGGWVFEFYFDLPENLEVIERLTFHFDVYYEFAGHGRQEVSKKVYSIEIIFDVDKDSENMQATLWDVCEDIDEFWDNNESYLPPFPDAL